MPSAARVSAGRLSACGALLLELKAISNSGLGHEVARLCGVVLELAPQIGDVDAHVVIALRGAEAPDVAQQVAVRENAAGVRDEAREQAVLGRGEVHVL